MIGAVIRHLKHRLPNWNGYFIVLVPMRRPHQPVEFSLCHRLDICQHRRAVSVPLFAHPRDVFALWLDIWKHLPTAQDYEPPVLHPPQVIAVVPHRADGVCPILLKLRIGQLCSRVDTSMPGRDCVRPPCCCTLSMDEREGYFIMSPARYWEVMHQYSNRQ
jgi:hypothetical protein